MANMSRLGDLLPKALEQTEALRAARAQMILRDWVDIVGASLATRSCPDRYSRGTVWVAVTGSAWAQELRMQKETILRRLDLRSHERGLFTDLRFGVRPLPDNQNQNQDLEPLELLDQSEERALTIKEIAAKRLARWNRAGDS